MKKFYDTKTTLELIQNIINNIYGKDGEFEGNYFLVDIKKARHKHSNKWLYLASLMVRLTGVEPVTAGAETQCSIQLSHRRI